ncbi:MAG: ABC transporter permease [Pseudomonadota bacterium]
MSISIAKPKDALVIGQDTSAGVSLALADMAAGLKAWEIWGVLGWNEIKQRYRRTFLGPFWITMTQAIMVGSIGFTFSYLFNTPMQDYMPFLTLGLLVWGLISTIIGESCNAFTQNAGFIKQMPLPKSVFVLTLIWRNVLMFAHHMVIYIPVVIFFDVPLTPQMLWAVPGLLIICLNGYWLGLLLGTLCTRFRDIPPVVSVMLQVAFFVTPIFWKPQAISQAVSWIVVWNPLAYMLEAVRGPLLGRPPDFTALVIMIFITAAGFVVGVAFFARYRSRIPYWL